MTTESAELDAAELEVLRALTRRGVSFVVIGSWALNYHGVARLRGDLDVVVEASESNAAKLLVAFSDLRLAGPRLTLEELSKPGKKVPLRFYGVDILTSAEGLSFDELSKEAALVDVAGLRVPVPSSATLLKLKGLSTRPKDRPDYRRLRKKMSRPATGCS